MAIDVHAYPVAPTRAAMPQGIAGLPAPIGPEEEEEAMGTNTNRWIIDVNLMVVAVAGGEEEEEEEATIFPTMKDHSFESLTGVFFFPSFLSSET